MSPALAGGFLTTAPPGKSLLFLNLAGFHLLTVDYYVECGFFINGFYCVEICSLYTHFGESFYQELMLNFVKCFFCIH